MIEKLFEGCENLGWSVSEDQDAGTVELESYSPAGENLVVTVEKENFAEKVREYAEDFDIDEHIEMWVEARNNGVAGVPKSTRELVEDAEEIKEMLLQLADALHEIEVSKDFLCSVIDHITVVDGHVASISFKNGLTNKFIYKATKPPKNASTKP